MAVRKVCLDYVVPPHISALIPDDALPIMMEIANDMNRHITIKIEEDYGSQLSVLQMIGLAGLFKLNSDYYQEMIDEAFDKWVQDNKNARS